MRSWIPALTLCTPIVACGWLDAPERGAPPDHLQCALHKDDRCFVPIPGGTFLMGAQATDPGAPGYDPDARPEEGPVRQVTVAPFHLQMHEFLHADLFGCVEAGACTLGAPLDRLRGAGALAPVAAGLTWDEAAAACASLGARLPTEAEWEFAARGTDGRRFPWGDAPPCGLGEPVDRFPELPKAAWSSLPGCEGADPPQTPRGRSPYGVVDLAWGHWEWVADWYGPYPAGQASDPTGPAAGDRRVQRGGAWNAADPAELRSAARGSMKPDARSPDVGFRCAW